jgi:molybdate transport repressor ModE-like protein
MSQSRTENLIEHYTTDDRRLTCANAHKVAAKLQITPEEVGVLTRQMNIRISACDLGQFGKQPLGAFRQDVHDDLRYLANEEGRIYCKNARLLARKSNLKSVRTALLEGGIDVVHCQLGCFTEKRRSRWYVRTKTWIENQNGELLFGKGKTEILEEIGTHGTVEAAADALGMSHTRAWEHIRLLQRNIEDPMVEGDNPVELTTKADVLLRAYRQLKQEIEDFADQRFKELILKERGRKDRTPAAPKSPSLKRAV